MPSFNLQADSVVNVSINCRSSADQTERQLFRLVNAYAVSAAVIRCQRKAGAQNVKGDGPDPPAWLASGKPLFSNMTPLQTQ